MVNGPVEISDESGRVPPGSLAAHAYRRIEQSIVTLDLAPGAATSEAALAAALGLGRTPVREAVQRLAWEGLLEIRPRAGLAVAALHPGDWVRVIDARVGVEAVLAQGAARFAGPRERDALRQAEDGMRLAMAREDAEAFMESDKRLDEVIAATAANPFAVRVAQSLQTHSRRFWFRFRRDTGLEEAVERHGALIGAILRGSEADAVRASDRLMALLRRQAEAVAKV